MASDQCFLRASWMAVASLNWCYVQPGMPCMHERFLDCGVHVVVLQHVGQPSVLDYGCEHFANTRR